jgi:anaerobic selenocysteine-containing dehydrogenase
MHPSDAAARNLAEGQQVRIFNNRGSFRAKVIIGEVVKAGVVVSQSIWWNKYAADGRNCNATTSTRLTDFGAGATFFDNLVQVEAAE